MKENCFKLVEPSDATWLPSTVTSTDARSLSPMKACCLHQFYKLGLLP